MGLNHFLGVANAEFAGEEFGEKGVTEERQRKRFLGPFGSVLEHRPHSFSEAGY
jgi:hypothetical protein